MITDEKRPGGAQTPRTRANGGNPMTVNNRTIGLALAATLAIASPAAATTKAPPDVPSGPPEIPVVVPPVTNPPPVVTAPAVPTAVPDVEAIPTAAPVPPVPEVVPAAPVVRLVTPLPRIKTRVTCRVIPRGAGRAWYTGRLGFRCPLLDRLRSRGPVRPGVLG